MQWENRQQVARMQGDGTLSSIHGSWSHFNPSDDSGLAGVGAGRNAGLDSQAFMPTAPPQASPEAYEEGTLMGLISNPLASAFRSISGPDAGSRSKMPSPLPSRSMPIPTASQPPPRRSANRGMHATSQDPSASRGKSELSSDRRGWNSLRDPSVRHAQPNDPRSKPSAELFNPPDRVLQWQRGVADSSSRQSMYAPEYPTPSPVASGFTRSISTAQSMENLRQAREEEALDVLSPMGGVPVYRPAAEYSRSFGRATPEVYGNAYETSAMEEIYEDDASLRQRLGVGPSSSSSRPSHSRRGDESASSDRPRANIPTVLIPQVEMLTPASYNGSERRGSEGNVLSSPVSGLPFDSSRRASFSAVSLPVAEDNSHQGKYLGEMLSESNQPPRGDSMNSSISVRTIQPKSSAETTKTAEGEDNSGDTAKAGDWAKELTDMMHSATVSGEVGTLMPSRTTATEDSNNVEDEAEETLWFVPPPIATPIQGSSVTPTESSGRPRLQLDTHGSAADHEDDTTPSSADNSEGPSTLTDSEEIVGSRSKVKRNKSFAKTKDQWNERPAAEDVYENLAEFFPRIDLDKPVVVNPVVETTFDPTSPRTTSPASSLLHLPSLQEDRPRSKFNKAEARKSIRVVAEGRKKHLSKIAPATKIQDSGLARKRSSSMWGHNVVEATPSKIQSGQVPILQDDKASDTGAAREFLASIFVSRDLIR